MQGGSNGSGGLAALSMGRQLGRMMGMLTSVGIVLAAFLVFWQFVAAPGKGPFELLAYAESKFELGRMNGNMAIGPDGKQMTEADYQGAIAKAQREGQAVAELEFQKKMAAVQSSVERLNGAYAALYQRANVVAQAGLQMEAELMKARQQIVVQGQSGKTTSATIHDMLCEVGNVSSCDRARQLRREAVEEMNDLAGTGTGTTLQELMGDTPDPANVIVNLDTLTNGSPGLVR
jgi:hypothetical protein